MPVLKNGQWIEADHPERWEGLMLKMLALIVLVVLVVFGVALLTEWPRQSVALTAAATPTAPLSPLEVHLRFERYGLPDDITPQQ